MFDRTLPAVLREFDPHDRHPLPVWRCLTCEWGTTQVPAGPSEEPCPKCRGERFTLESATHTSSSTGPLVAELIDAARPEEAVVPCEACSAAREEDGPVSHEAPACDSPPEAPPCVTCGKPATGGTESIGDDLLLPLCPDCASKVAAAAPPEAPEERQRVGPSCAYCGEPATCIGSYEGQLKEEPACDGCCGHGNEDGRCRPIAAALNGEARGAEVERLREENADLRAELRRRMQNAALQASARRDEERWDAQAAAPPAIPAAPPAELRDAVDRFLRLVGAFRAHPDGGMVCLGCETATSQHFDWCPWDGLRAALDAPANVEPVAAPPAETVGVEVLRFWRCVSCGDCLPGPDLELAAAPCRCGTGEGQWAVGKVEAPAAPSSVSTRASSAGEQPFQVEQFGPGPGYRVRAWTGDLLENALRAHPSATKIAATLNRLFAARPSAALPPAMSEEVRELVEAADRGLRILKAIVANGILGYVGEVQSSIRQLDAALAALDRKVGTGEVQR